MNSELKIFDVDNIRFFYSKEIEELLKGRFIMKLKRCLSILSCCLLSMSMLIGCSGNNAGSNNTNNDNNNANKDKDYTITLNKEYSQLTADDKGNIYGATIEFPESGTSESKDLFENAKVLMDVMDGKGNITKTLDLPNGNVANIAVNDKNIFVFYFEKISILDLDGKTVKEIKFSNDVYVAKPVAFGDKIFFMYQDSSSGYSDEMELAYVDANSDDVKKPGIGEVYNIMKYKDNILKLYSYDENGDIKTTNFDCVGLNVKDTTTEDSDNFDIETQYSQSNDKVYVFNYSGLFAKKYGENSSISLITFENSEYSSMQLSGNTLYLFGPYDKKIRVLDINALDDKINSQNQLVIYTQDGAITDDETSLAGKAIQRFKASHPDTIVSLQYVAYDKYYDDLNAKVMTQDSSFDIFYLPESKVDSYIKNGVMANLKESSVLMDKFNKNINPKMVNVVARDDYYFGVPILFLSNVMTFNLDTFNELSIDVPGEVWTYDEFFSILDTLKEKDRSLYFQTSQTDFYHLVDYINYSVDVKNKQVNIDKEKLISILTKLKEIQDYANAAYEEDGSDLLYPNSFLMSYGASYDLNNTGAKTRFSNPPVISKDDPKYFIPGTEFLAVNKKSKNVDLACELLSYMYDESVIFTTDAMNQLPIYKDMLKYNEILKKDLEEELGGSSDESLNELFEQQKITDEYVTVYNNILDKYGSSIEIFSTDAGSKIMDDFNEEKITADEAADKIINLVKNMIEE